MSSIATRSGTPAGEPTAVKGLERYIILNAIDRLWQEHLYAMDALREGAARNRIDYELLRTSEPLDAALFSYLARRSHLG